MSGSEFLRERDTTALVLGESVVHGSLVVAGQGTS
jgi:hypothetical protein